MHMEPPPTPLIKSKHSDKSDKFFVKIILHRDPTSATSDLYELKMALLDNGNPEEFLFFSSNFNMALAESRTLGADTKVQYFCTLVCGEALCQFDSLSYDVEGTKRLTVEAIILGLAA